MGGSERADIAALLLLIVVTFIPSCCCRNEATYYSIEYEKQALLAFKQDLTDTSNSLSSWINEIDCCEWLGVVCNNITGHVTELRLKNFALGGSLNPSLLHLQQFHVLDLAMNNFDGVRIPSFLGSIDSLRHLDLSQAGFQGLIPHQLGNLSNLVSLSVASDMLKVDNIQWLAGLSNLQRLDMSRVNLSEVSNWLQVINMMPSLTELHLSWCFLSQISQVIDFNLSSLTILDLSGNGFTSSMPKWIFDLRKLVSLDLHSNSFKGSLPEGLWNLTSLRYLDLHNNSLNGTLPRELMNLSSLVYLELSSNELSGTVPDTIGKLCNMNFFHLSENKLEGLISDVIDDMTGCFSYAIQSIYLDRNRFSGQLTNELGQFKNLKELGVGLNFISGPIPHVLGQLSKLVYLDISYNKLEGIVAQSLFENLTSLRLMLASGNSLTLEVDQNWVPPIQFEILGMRSWKLGPHFPNWIRSQKNIISLDLSSTGMSGTIPSWIWSLSVELAYLNLSHNQLQGEVSIVCCINYVDLGSNQLTGPLPHIAFKGISQLELSNNSFSGGLSNFLCDQANETQRLVILNLGKNLLSGEIPDCWMNWPSIKAINLSNNNLTGSIPRSTGDLKDLLFLHLRNNSLSGGMPSSLENCTELQAIDLAENKFYWNIPIWRGLRFLNLRILILRSNRFQGEITPELCHLTSLRILDVANNNLSGVIPRCFKNFTSMVVEKIDSLYRYPGYLERDHLATKGSVYDYDIILPFVTSIDLSNNNFSGMVPEELTFLLGLKSLNLSGNQLGGVIPMYIGKMVQLESLDLSRNQLSGSIPSGISQLSFLSFLNLSYNNLSGEIPLSSQMQTFSASSFVGNQLCGRPLAENCSSSTKNDDAVTEIEEDDAEGGIDLLYVFMGSGFVVGFWGVCFTLILKRSWRYAYFRFVDELWFKIFLLSTKCMFKR